MPLVRCSATYNLPLTGWEQVQRYPSRSPIVVACLLVLALVVASIPPAVTAHAAQGRYLWDGAWVLLPADPSPQGGAIDVVLANGSLLLLGGLVDGLPTTSVSLWDVTTSAWALLPPSQAGHYGGIAQVLSNDSVLLAGGWTESGSAGTLTTAVELLSLSGTPTWTPQPPLPSGIGNGTSILLADDTVTLEGGIGGDLGALDPALYTAAFSRDPLSGQWTPLTNVTLGEGATTSAMTNGSWMRIGGGNGLLHSSQPNLTYPGMTVWDLGAGNWTPIPLGLSINRSHHQTTTLPDGTLLVSGGYHAEAGGPTGLPPIAEVVDPALGVARGISPLMQPRYDHGAAALPSGEVLVVGGIDATAATLSSAELYNATADAWDQVPALPIGVHQPVVTALPNGTIFVSGGLSADGGAVGQTLLFIPGSPTPRPLVATFVPAAPQVAPGGTTLLRLQLSEQSLAAAAGVSLSFSIDQGTVSPSVGSSDANGSFELQVTAPALLSGGLLNLTGTAFGPTYGSVLLQQEVVVLALGEGKVRAGLALAHTHLRYMVVPATVPGLVADLSGGNRTIDAQPEAIALVGDQLRLVQQVHWQEQRTVITDDGGGVTAASLQVERTEQYNRSVGGIVASASSMGRSTIRTPTGGPPQTLSTSTEQLDRLYLPVRYEPPVQSLQVGETATSHSLTHSTSITTTDGQPPLQVEGDVEELVQERLLEASTFHSFEQDFPVSILQDQALAQVRAYSPDLGADLWVTHYTDITLSTVDYQEYLVELDDQSQPLPGSLRIPHISLEVAPSGVGGARLPFDLTVTEAGAPLPQIAVALSSTDSQLDPPLVHTDDNGTASASVLLPRPLNSTVSVQIDASVEDPAFEHGRRTVTVVVHPDVRAPTIDLMPPAFVVVGVPLQLVAEVSDDSGVVPSATLWWSPPGAPTGGAPLSATANISGGIATFPLRIDEIGTLRYWLTATDGSGNEGRWPAPAAEASLVVRPAWTIQQPLNLTLLDGLVDIVIDYATIGTGRASLMAAAPLEQDDPFSLGIDFWVNFSGAPTNLSWVNISAFGSLDQLPLDANLSALRLMVLQPNGTWAPIGPLQGSGILQLWANTSTTGRMAVRSLLPLLPPPEPTFLLVLGPVLDTTDRVVTVGNVSLFVVGGQSLARPLGLGGTATFPLWESAKGRMVSISIVAEGYQPLTYNDLILPNGTLRNDVPRLELTEGPPPDGHDDGLGAPNPWLVGLVVAMVLVVATLVVALRSPPIPPLAQPLPPARRKRGGRHGNRALDSEEE